MPRRIHTLLGDATTLAGAVAAGVRHLGAAVARINAGQIELWERYLRAQRPWEADRLHWERDRAGGWRLVGQVPPPPGPALLPRFRARLARRPADRGFFGGLRDGGEWCD